MPTWYDKSKVDTLLGNKVDTATANATIAAAVADEATRADDAFAPRRATLAPAKFTTPATMSSPPTVGALATATAITGSKLWRSTEGTASGAVILGRFSYPGAAKPVVYSPAYPNYLYTVFKHRTSSNEATAPWKAEFVFDGTTLELLFKGMAGFLRIRVDGEYVNETPTLIGNTGSVYYLPVTFASRANRVITVEGQGIPWGGVATGPLDSITPAPVKRPRVVIVGDSYSEGSVDGNTNAVQCWVRQFGDLMGWPDVINAGVGGTGYLNPGASPRVKFRDRIQNDVIDLAPDIVIVAGGHNDTTTSNAAYTAAALQTEATAFYTALRAALPNALIIAVGPFAAGSQVAQYPTYQAAIFAAAAGKADFTIDTLTSPIFTGTGTTAATTGNGNSDLYIWTDGTHPTLAGQKWLARFMAGQVSALLSS